MAETSQIFGINSGLDTGDILSKLILLQRRPIALIEAKREIEDTKLESFRELKSRLQTFKSIVTTLNTQARFLVTTGIFSNNSPTDQNQVASLETTSLATSGTFTLVVNQIARESKVVSEGFAETTSEVNQGTLNITVGSTTTTVTIDSDNNTIDAIRLAINNSGADVKASFINDGSDTNPVKLIVSGTKTGEDNAVTVELVAQFLGAGTQPVLTLTETQAAQDASFTIDGIAVTKSNNVINDVIDSTTLTLTSSGSGTITLSSDLDGIKEKINDFVDGYNELTVFLQEQLAIDVNANTTGTLFGNFTVQNLQQTLRSTISSRVNGITADFQYLSQIGITTQSDGILEIDDGDLTTALSTDVANVSQLFSSKGTTTDSGVTFIGFTTETVAGTYDLRVSGGVPQLAASGTSTFTDTTGSGNFYAGADGNDEEGFNFRIDSLVDGSYGTVTLSIGVAEILNRQLRNLTDASLDGPLVSEIDTIVDTIAEFDDTVTGLEVRLDVFAINLRNKFVNLEVVLGKLNSQKNVFEASLSGIQAIFEFRIKK